MIVEEEMDRERVIPKVHLGLEICLGRYVLCRFKSDGILD